MCIDFRSVPRLISRLSCCSPFSSLSYPDGPQLLIVNSLTGIPLAMPACVWSSVYVCGLNVNHVAQFKTPSAFHLSSPPFILGLLKRSREEPPFYSQHRFHRSGMIRKLCEGLNFNKLKYIC